MSHASAGSDVQHQRNGAALAAVLAAAIGSAVLGVLVLLGTTGVFSGPVLYGPAGGLSTRSTGAVVAWIVAWVVLHKQWKDRDVPMGSVVGWSVALVLLSVVATFPPVWDLLK